ncbi:hypothetical protein DPSP01_009095 [Paraphaeosphaeria sporulosa]
MANLHPLAGGLHILLFILGILSLLLRFYSRAFVIRRWGLDDTLAVATLFLYVALQAVHQLMLNAGCGLDGPNECSPTINASIPKILLATQVLYALTHFTIKSTFLAFYVHLSPARTFRILVYVGAALNASVFITNELLIVLRCQPPKEVFSPGSTPDAKCMSQAVTFWSPVVLNLIVDVYILTLPIPVIWGLRMPAKRRLAVLAIFSSGFSAILTSAFWVFAWGKMRDHQTSPALAINTIISSVELFFAVMAVNMPAFKPLWTRMVGDVTTPPAASYKMDGWSREKSTPRSRPAPVESSIISSMGKSSRDSRGVLGSESEEDLVEAQTPLHSDGASAAEAGRRQVWMDEDGIEFVIAVPSRSDKYSSSSERRRDPRDEICFDT